MNLLLDVSAWIRRPANMVGVLGLGALDMDTALKRKAVGFKVAGWSAAPKSAAGIACFSGPNGPMQLLGRVDKLVVLPLTEATRPILNASLFAKLRRGEPLDCVTLTNAGRGSRQSRPTLPRSILALKEASLEVFGVSYRRRIRPQTYDGVSRIRGVFVEFGGGVDWGGRSNPPSRLPRLPDWTQTIKKI